MPAPVLEWMRPTGGPLLLLPRSLLGALGGADERRRLIKLIPGVSMPDFRVQRSVLDQADPEELVAGVIGPAYDHVDIYEGASELEQSLAPLTSGQRHLVAIHWCVSEVCNGGLDQFFGNATGILMPEALEGFRAVGADDYAELLRRAASAVFPGSGVPRDSNARVEALERLPTEERLARLEELDDAFYAGLTELYRRAAAYVRHHPSEFALP